MKPNIIELQIEAANLKPLRQFRCDRAPLLRSIGETYLSTIIRQFLFLLIAARITYLPFRSYFYTNRGGWVNVLTPNFRSS